MRRETSIVNETFREIKNIAALKGCLLNKTNGRIKITEIIRSG